MKFTSKLLFLLIIFVLTSNFTCDEPCIDPPNELTFEVSVEPASRVIDQVDTLWFNASFDVLVDLQNREGMLDISNASCILIMKILKIDPATNIVTEGVDQFDFIQEQGRLSRDIFDPSNPVDPCTAVLDFNCDDIDCTFRIGFLPLQPGIYAISSGLGSCNRAQVSGECFEKNEIKNIRFNNPDLHPEILTDLDIRELVIPLNNGTETTLVTENNDFLYVFEVE